MSNGAYRRDDTPPPSGPKLKIFRLKAGEQANFAIFGTKIRGYWTHWSGRTDPCLEDKESCPGCKRQDPQRWKGYLFARHESTLECGFLEVTKVMRDKLMHLAVDERYLRGMRIKACRGNGQKTSVNYMLLRPWGQEHEGEVIPNEVLPDDTLRVLFEWRRPKTDGKDGGQ
jgi:hypothetical protein